MQQRVQCFQNFTSKANAEGKSVCGYYFSESFSEKVAMNRHQAGVSLLQDLSLWSLDGGAAEEARRSLRKGGEQGLVARELKSAELSSWRDRLGEFSRRWQQSKGFFRIRFLLSPLRRSLEGEVEGERVFVCINGDDLDSVITIREWMPGAWYVDQLMQHPNGYRFSIDFLLISIFKILQREGATKVSLGFCPGIIEDPKTWVEGVLNLWGQLKVFYSPVGLYNFKSKYSSEQVNRYLLLDPKFSSIKQLMAMEAVTMVLPFRS
jgi:lysylphosphatidylglycerol synthetase-like protein (DUF2156 family)